MPDRLDLHNQVVSNADEGDAGREGSLACHQHNVRQGLGHIIDRQPGPSVPHSFSHAEYAQRLEQSQRADAVRVGCVLRSVERNLDVTLRRKIIDLVLLRLLDNANEICRISEIAVVDEKSGVHLVRIAYGSRPPAAC